MKFIRSILVAAVTALILTGSLAEAQFQNTPAGGVLNLGAGGYIKWAGRSVCTSPADGVVQCTNNAGTGFTRFVLGTNDASTNGVSIGLTNGNPRFSTGDGTTARGLSAPQILASDGTSNMLQNDGGPILGGNNASFAVRMRTTMATPGSLTNGDYWVESDTGGVTGVYGLLKAQLNGATVLVAPSLVKFGRANAVTNTSAGTLATYTPTADGTFEVSANVLVTSVTTATFNIECAYTDEGNTARVITNMPFRLVGDTTALTATVTAGAGAVPYQGVPLHIRVKANTAITIRTQAAGTYTTVVYNAEGSIRRLQ